MKNFKKILAPTDFSPYSDEGLRYAALLAKEFGAEVVALHVLSEGEMREKEKLPPPSGYVDEIFKQAKQEAAEHFKGVSQAAGNGFKARGEVASGVPYVEIIRKAREEKCDLIVMATHGRTGLQHMLMGSVAEHVVRMADSPVLTIRPKDHAFKMP